jgi:hypothetical protein
VPFERTLTAPVDIMRCLKSIKEHAFTASTYPLVITLEDHLTADLQAKVAEVKFTFISSSARVMCRSSILTPNYFR